MNQKLNISIRELESLCEAKLLDLFKLSDDQYGVTAEGSEGKSKKQLLGYLVDLAVFQHQRLVRSQCEDIPEVIHDVDTWLNCNHYTHIKSRNLILFWKSYNRFILDLISQMDEALLLKQTKIGLDHMTLEDTFIRYVEEVRTCVDLIVQEEDNFSYLYN